MLNRFLLFACTAAGLVALPTSAQAATCSDYDNQAAAQRAADTRDADGDGIYCESLPCPCSKSTGGGSGGEEPKPKPKKPRSCRKPTGVQDIGFSATKYRHIRAHFLAAVKAGWPRILVVNRPGADARRDRLLEGYETRKGYDRDEYPPAVGRGRGPGLTRGSDPTGWRASVRYVASGENRSHGSTMGTKLRRFCNGTRFRYVFY
ncbi:MAG: hypothetical protein JHC95_16305 [Solirubrobacteraceae bacterium]|nr:hypothetical protein [Solirubrobacteraceae bacterium]